MTDRLHCATFHTLDGDELRRRIAAAIFDPGNHGEGYKGDRTLTEWQTDAVMRVVQPLLDRVERAEASLLESGKDTARLDFPDEANRRLNAKYGTTYRWTLIMNHNVNRLMLGAGKVDLSDIEANGLPSCRDAIDAALSSSERSTS